MTETYGNAERLPVSKSDAAHRRAAELVSRSGRLERQLAGYFNEITEVIDAMRLEGSAWQGPVLPPTLEAAHRIHLAGVEGEAELEAELELARLGEVPLMRLES